MQALLDALRQLAELAHVSDAFNQSNFHEAATASEQWSSDQWRLFVSRAFFTLNITAFLERGWLIGLSEGGRGAAVAIVVQAFEIGQYERRLIPVVVVDDRTEQLMPASSVGKMIAYPGKGPIYILLNGSDASRQEVTDAHIAFRQGGRWSREPKPPIAKLFSRIGAMELSQFMNVQRQFTLREEWWHVMDRVRIKDIQAVGANLLSTKEAQELIGVLVGSQGAVPLEETLRQTVVMIRAFRREILSSRNVFAISAEAHAGVRRGAANGTHDG